MKNRNETTYETPEQIIEHISRLMAEAEAMIAGPVAEQAGGKFDDLKHRLEDAKERLTDVYQRARKGVVAGAKYADTTIRENPYISIGAALGIGVLVGMLIKRSSR
jgi:ElaB/YqjD/DUF883 family membrane-anchored ribosome-binding protein